MREIKFRAWDKKECDFINIKSFGFLEDGEVWYAQAIDERENKIEPPYFTGENDLVIMQYTGLKDRNGTPIYEGDVYEYTVTIGYYNKRRMNIRRNSVVEWRNGAFWVRDYLLSEALEGDDNPIIIGNIYEHSHLLKEEVK